MMGGGGETGLAMRAVGSIMAAHLNRGSVKSM